jgi:FtsH-binding integral membrane protein
MNRNYSSGEMRTDTFAPEQAATERGVFIMRVYGHLLGAIALFTLIEVYLFRTGMAESITRALLGVNWLLVLGGFMLAGWLARGMASRAGGLGSQYAGLLLYVVAQAVIFTPMLFIADSYAGGGVIRSAAVVTLAGFVGLTAVVFYTRKDFSFLGALLRWAGILALVAIAAAVLFGLELGTWFSVAMVGLAGAAILYDTSKILRHWPNDRYVGAALELFSSVALMFWYVLRLFMGRR